MSSSSGIPISSFIVEDWFNGLYTATMLGTLWVIAFSGHFEGMQKKYHCALVFLMFFCSTMHSSLQWFFYSSAVNSNEGTDGVQLIKGLTDLAPWLEATGDAFFCLNIFIADWLFIWRCWVIWQRRWYVVILPACASLTGAVLAGLIINDQVVGLESHVTFVVVQKTKQFVTLSSAYFALSIATSLTTTLLIALRIFLIQRAARKIGVKSKSYSAILEILIESAALYSATLLIFVVLNSRHNINFYYAQNIHAQIAGLAPTLIILRVAAGKSRRDDEWSTNVPDVGGTMQFAPRAGLSHGSGATGTVLSSAPERDVDVEAGYKTGDFAFSVPFTQRRTAGSSLEELEEGKVPTEQIPSEVDHMISGAL